MSLILRDGFGNVRQGTLHILINYDMIGFAPFSQGIFISLDTEPTFEPYMGFEDKQVHFGTFTLRQVQHSLAITNT